MAVLCANPHILYREFNQRDQIATNASSSVPVFNVGFSATTSGRDGGKRDRRYLNKASKTEAFWPEVSGPSTQEMEPITDMDHLDQILVQAQENSQPILIDWMANWCRKCIYLKPKLEKLAAEYRNIMKFYYVDVNSVPQPLVKRGNISKMPTIQIWKDGEMKEEVIGGHKAWLVVDEVRDMIRKYI